MGQENRDSLLSVIANNESTQLQKIQALNELAYQYRVSQPDSALTLGRKSLLLAMQIDDQLGIGNAKLTIATAQTNLGNYYEAIKGFQEARLIFEELKERNSIAQCLNNLGALYSSIDELDQALDYFLQALVIYEETNEVAMLAASINNVGYIYKMNGKYDEALDYLYRSLKISSTVSSDYYLYPTYNIGSAYMHKDFLDSAERYLNESLELSSEIEDNYILSLTLMDLGSLNLKKGEIKQAEVSFLGAYDLSNNTRLKSIQWKAAEFLSVVYEKQNNTASALRYHKIFKNINDSIYNIDLNKKVAFLEAESKLNEAEIKSELQRREKELLLKNELMKAVWTRNTLILALLLMGLILYLSYKNIIRRKRVNEDLRKLNSTIKSQALELRTANDEIRAMNANLEDMVDERTKEIKLKNEILREYLASNSHIVRAPLARILGLIDLFDPEDKSNFTFINKNIYESARELDDILRDINEKLSGG